MAFNPFTTQLISNASMATSITSNPQYIQFQDNIGIQLNWTGTPTGTFSVQVSTDHIMQGLLVINPGNWITLPLNPAITASGSPDVAYVDLNQLSAFYVRVIYTASSGTGTLNCYIAAKGV